MTQRRRYLMWMSFTMESHVRSFHRLLESYADDPQAVFEAARDGKLCPHGGRETELVQLMKSKANEWYIDRCIQFLDQNKIGMVLFEDENYPALLKEIYLPPVALYIKGTMPKEIPLPIAMIGSRRCSNYGREVAMQISEELGKHGVCIVSGMAHGIDCTSAIGALKNKANPFPTIAVLGCGVDVIYPAENRTLYEQISERGAVISEFVPGVKPRPTNFPQRNRIISGLSRGVVVVEAARKSGTRITVNCALEQNRDVFAVPGRIMDYLSQGSNDMIHEGIAKPVFDIRDILEEYGIAVEKLAEPVKTDIAELDFEKQLVVRLLQVSERDFDELCAMTSWSAAKLNSVLTAMELSGIIKQLSGRVYTM